MGYCCCWLPITTGYACLFGCVLHAYARSLIVSCSPVAIDRASGVKFAALLTMIGIGVAASIAIWISSKISRYNTHV
jgi:hypothetical protein